MIAWLREHQDVRLVTTWPVLTEVCALLARRRHNEAALDYLRWIQRGALDVDRAGVTTLANVLAISERFADLPSTWLTLRWRKRPHDSVSAPSCRLTPISTCVATSGASRS
ncbi:MAG TPA: hypothetical protein VMG60_14970 [Burkholderiaceae bacterium]|nr:hypothetical protein [Burkholderiaceae bacterium]